MLMTKTKLFQLSAKKIVINSVGKYAGWDDFENFFNQSLGLFSKFETKNKITSISFNTIDRLPVSDASQFGHFFQCNGEYIPNWFSNVNHPFDIRLGMGHQEKILIINRYYLRAGYSLKGS